MKRVIKIKNAFGNEDKYVLRKEYEGFGVYQRMTPNGYLVSQNWLISNNETAELVVEPYNNVCEEELLDMIDSYNNCGKFGVKAVTYLNSLCMHDAGDFV